MTTSTADAHQVLTRAAFGDDPGRWPLPAAATPHDRWLRAVAAGGQGRYAAALAELAVLDRTARGPLRSLAHSTRASFLRQLGWHTRARGWDGRALALAGTDFEARADALTGLAADALGVGRFTAARRLLQHASDCAAEHARLRVRQAWVAAELAMVQGYAPEAVDHAYEAVASAAQFSSARHKVKSDVVLAAALCSAGELDRSRQVADAALQRTQDLALVPLRWALACLLADIGSAVFAGAQVIAIRDGSADTVRLRGGLWSAR